MPIVVAVRRGGEPRASAAELAADVRGTLDRALASGARLVGVSADGASFGFDDDAVEDAIEFTVSLVGGDGSPPIAFRVGLGVGDLAHLRDPAGFDAFAVGSAHARAIALARIAGDGEVLVDLDLAEARSGALLALGKRVASLQDLAGEGAGSRFRAIVLDVREPFRREGGASVEHLRAPHVVGREGSFAMIDSVMPGGLAVLRAMAGVGGTRFLDEVRLRATRALFIEPVGSSVEPLGALRVALSRTASGRTRELAPATNEAFAALLSGQGVDIDAASDLVNAWLHPGGDADDERSWVLIDDATLVDRATLEAIGHAASVPDTHIAVVVRVDEGDVLPPALSGLVVEAEVTLRPLAQHEAAAAIEEACGPGVSPEVVRRWTRRGGGIPLALVESLRHGLALGDLAIRTDDDGSSVVVPRAKGSGRGRTLGPRGWIARRVGALAADRPGDRMVLALACLAGADAAEPRIVEAAAELVDAPLVEAALERLVRDAVLVRHEGLVSPSSRTLREVVLETLEEATRKALHAAYAGVVARGTHGLDLAEAAHHAALAGDHLGAGALAARAAERCRRAGLKEWADSLLAFARAEGGDVAPFHTTPSPAPRPSMPSPAPEPAHEPVLTFADGAITDEAPAMADPPRLTLGVQHLSTGQIAALPAPPPMLMPDIVMPGPPQADDEDDVPPPPSVEPSSVREGLRQLAQAARKALVTADHVALESALTAMEVVGGSRNAVTRLRGLAAVARGEVEAGLVLLRRARAQALTEEELARGALAHSIALEVAGQRDDAILEAMTALAIERRLGNAELAQPARRVLQRLVERHSA